MAIELSIVQQRGTIFIPVFLSYSEEKAAEYADLLPGAKPVPAPITSPFGGPNMIPEGLQQGSSWQLVRGNTRIAFLPNRVDVFKDWISPRHVNEENDFLSLCKTILGAVLEREKVMATRVAYSPAFARDKDATFSEDMLWDVLLTQTTLGDVKPMEVSINRNYRVKRILAGHEVMFNFRTSFGSANHTLPDGTVATGSVLVNFDINSIQEGNYQFETNLLNAFFDSALGFSDELYNNFMGE